MYPYDVGLHISLTSSLSPIVNALIYSCVLFDIDMTLVRYILDISLMVIQHYLVAPGDINAFSKGEDTEV